MKPFFKYSGGKSREAKFVSSLVESNEITRFVEPFCGSAAMSFYLEKPALVTDVRKDVITTLKVVQDKQLYVQLQKRCNDLSNVSDIKDLEKEFYHQRDNMWGCVDPLDVAWRFIVVRQLVFSGMDRINLKTGKENAPFGWYKKFKCNLSVEHHNLLQSWEIKQQTFEQTFNEVKEGDFVFSDPPYLSRNSVYGGTINPDLEMHKNLQRCHDECKASWMLVHCSHPEYELFANKHKTLTKEFMYSQNFVGRDNSKSKTEHLYIMNR